MDSVLNRLKTKVSTVLPGNPLTREYELGKLLGSAGPGMLWNLFAAKKRSTQQEATIWAFEKKSIDHFPKIHKEMMIELLKHGVLTLTRIKHPKVLSVVQPLEESRESLAFASEPLLSSLCSVLSNGRVDTESSTNVQLNDVEIKYGLLQLSEALYFLHSDCHRLHLNIVPSAVVINKFGLWKITGFEFSKLVENKHSSDFEANVNLPMWQSNLPSACQPVLIASSPEAILQGQASVASDMFSFGLFICTLFNQGRSVLDHGNDYSTYRQTVKNMAPKCATLLSKMPDNLREYVKMMLSTEQQIRPNALQFSRTPYFEDASMSVLKSIDNMYQLDNLARSQFYKSLPSTIPTLPKRLCLFRVFPQIAEDFSNHHMVPFILPAVLQIMDIVNQDEFVQHMLPRLIPIMQLKEPVQIILLLLQNLPILLRNFPAKEFRLHVLPLLHSALDTDNRAIQTRVSCLVCIAKLLDHLDRWTVMDDIFPFLQQIKSREPSILVSMFGIYRIAFSHEKLGINRDKLATRVLPHLIPLSVESSLNLKQYCAFAELIRAMCAQLEREQRNKLEQLHGVQEEASLFDSLSASSTNGNLSTNSCSQLMDQIMKLYLNDGTSGFQNQVTPISAPSQSTTYNNGSGSSGVNTELTLEQKRKLAFDQSQQDRFRAQPHLDSIQPTNAIPVQTKPAPLDLTSTLINSNLMAMANRNMPVVNQTINPGISTSVMRPSVNPVNYLTMNQYNSVVPGSTFPQPVARWNPPRNTDFQRSSNHSISLGSDQIMNFSQTNTFKPLSQTDIDDLLG